MNRAHLDFQSASEPTTYAVDGRHRLSAIEIAIDRGRVVAVNISWPEFLADMDDDRFKELVEYVWKENDRRDDEAMERGGSMRFSPSDCYVACGYCGKDIPVDDYNAHLWEMHRLGKPQNTTMKGGE